MSMLQLLHNISIRHKLRLIITFTSGIVLLLASLIFISSDVRQFRNGMQADLRLLAKLTGRNSIMDLSQKNVSNTRNNLRLLQADPRIQFIHIFDESGSLFASYFNEYTNPDNKALMIRSHLSAYEMPVAQLGIHFTPYDLPKQGLSVFYLGFLDTLIPIYKEKTLLGAVYIRADTHALQQHLLKTGSLILVVFLLSLIFAFILASRLERIFTDPVFHLLDNMHVVTRARDYSIRAEHQSDDELGTLTDGFNDMLAEIEKSHLRLEAYQNELEKRVQLRTQELAASRDEALAANEQLSQARDAAELANRAKSTFLANISHELRTPLNGILGYAQILLRQEIDNSHKDSIRIIQQSGKYLLTLINDILDLSKIEADKLELHQHDFLLLDFIQSLEDIFAVRTHSKGIGFQVMLGKDSGFGTRDLPFAVFADEKHLRQILLNLLSNAVKFTQQGEVRLRIGYIGERLRFSVEDTGIGIAQSDLDQIFSPFVQVGHIMHKSEGTGLGLSITKKLADMMDSELFVESQLGKGSHFYLDLSLPESLQAPGKAEESENFMALSLSDKISSKPYRVLVVDDNLINRMVADNMLQQHGFGVDTLSDGQQALDYLNKKAPDLIIMDLIMPGMSGFECIQHIRNHPKGKQVPIMVASASAFAQDREKSLNLGANAFITKPLEEGHLLNQLAQLLPIVWQSKHTNTVAQTGPSPQQADYLYELFKLGDLHDLRQNLDEMHQQHPEQADFVEKFSELLRGFKEDEILEFLSQYRRTDHIAQ